MDGLLTEDCRERRRERWNGEEQDLVVVVWAPSIAQKLGRRRQQQRIGE